MSADVLSQAIDPASDRAVYKQIADHLPAVRHHDGVHLL